MTRSLYGAVVEIASRPRRLLVAILGVFLACSAGYALTEHKGPISSMWWAVVTGSTVGYGDQYPESTAGRFVGVVLIISMIVLVACATANLTARLIPDPHVFTNEEQEEIKAAERSQSACLERQEAALRMICDHLGLRYPQEDEASARTPGTHPGAQTPRV